MSEQLRTGVVGTGSMGRHHARIYDHLPDVDLVGVADADPEAAAAVAAEHDTAAMDTADLLDAVDAVSVAVPTRFHHETATDAIERGVSVLVEKPLTRNPDAGAELVERAREEDVVLQVGHIERFNPAVQTLLDVVGDLDVIAIEAQRLGPPVDRDSTDSVVLDLMVHDLDVVLSLLGAEVESVAAAGARDGNHVTANLTFADGVVGQFTASRVTQQKVRRLSITAEECRINVDYADQDVRIHRQSVPSYVQTNGDVRYRHESVIERPTVESGEPLQAELEAFTEAVRTGDDPPVTGEDGLRALKLARRIDRQAAGRGIDGQEQLS